MEEAEVASRRDAPGGIFDRLLDFLNRLDEAHVARQLARKTFDQMTGS